MTEPRHKTNGGHGPNGGNGAAIAAIVNQTMSQHLGLADEINRLCDAVKEGRLSERAQCELFSGSDRAVLEALNGMLDGLVKPLSVTSDYVARISKGDIPAKITDNYNGQFNDIKNSLNQCIESLDGLMKEMGHMSREHDLGDIDVAIDADKFQGAYKQVATGVNNMVAGHITVKKKAMACIAEFGKGNFDAPLEKFPGKKVFINETIERLRTNLQSFIAEMKLMSEEHEKGDIDVVIPADEFEGSYRVMAKGVNDMVQGHISVKKKAMACLAEFGKGNFEAPLEQFPGKKAFINKTFEEVRKNLKALIADADALVKAAVEGRLATRADASRHEGDFRKIVEGVNHTLDAVIGPLNVSADYVDKISKGDIPARITDTYNGDFNTIKNNLNTCIDAVNALVADAAVLSKAAVEGKLATRADASKHQGDFRKIVQGVDDCLDAVIGPLNVAAKYVDDISKGNIPAKITDNYNGDFNTIKNNLNTCIDAVNALVADAGLLSKAAVEGKLATRADAAKHQGDFRKIVQGVDDCLDAVIGPLNVAAKYVDDISKGNIPAKITDNYNGDFNTIKSNLNTCIDAVNALVADANVLAKAAVEGKLATRADATKHEGDFRKIVEGVNHTLDAVIGPLNVSADYVDKISKGDIPPKITDNYNGDFNTIKNNLNTCIDAVNALVADSNMLAKAAVEGKLTTRADGSKHGGDFRKIVEGVNRTLDEVIGPITDVAGVLDKLAGGDLTVQVTRNCVGDFKKLADAVNTVALQVRSAIQQIGKNTQALVSASEELAKVSQQMGASAEETSTQANLVSAASSQVTNNVSTVASAADEMGASIKEIAKNTAEATRVATTAVKTAEATNETITKLGQSSTEIGQVIKVITSIAQQTNLLALNATIEAARAGEAGKGFAVVANEVKELAKETAKATEDIGRKIEAIQGDTKGAVAAIGQIGTVIGQISDIQTTIASAVEEQSATTNEISRNLSEAAKGSADINRNIGGVAEGARSTASGAAETQKSAQSLEHMSAELQALVAQFKY